MLVTILELLGLILLCIGVGSLVLMRLRHPLGFVAWCGLRGLVGFFVLAAALNLCSMAHFSRALAVAGCTLVALVGFYSAGRCSNGGARVCAQDLLLSLGLIAFLATPVMMVFASPAMAHDAVTTWIPKAEAWVGGAEFEASHKSREWLEGYPRGGPAVAALLAYDIREVVVLQRFLAIIVSVFAVGAIAGIGELCGHSWVGVLAGLSPLLIPEYAAYLPTGYMDIVMSGAVVGVAVGFAIARMHPVGFLYAALIGAGAIACKQEGGALGLGVALMAVWAAFRSRTLIPVVLGLPAAISVLPWLMLSKGGETEVLSSLQIFMDNPARLLERCLAVAERYGLLLFETLQGDSLVPHAPFGPYFSLWAIVICSVAWLLRPGTRFGVLPVFPALLLSCIHFLVHAIAPHALSWQLAHSANRMFIQVAPLLLASACFRLCSGPMEVKPEAAVASRS